MRDAGTHLDKVGHSCTSGGWAECSFEWWVPTMPVPTIFVLSFTGSRSRVSEIEKSQM